MEPLIVEFSLSLTRSLPLALIRAEVAHASIPDKYRSSVKYIRHETRCAFVVSAPRKKEIILLAFVFLFCLILLVLK